MGQASLRTQRERWHSGRGAMPEKAVAAMLESLGIGWWSLTLRLYGFEEVNAANAAIVRRAFARHTDRPFVTSTWRRGDPIEGSGAGVPSVLSMQAANWRGGRGAHLTFSPVLPPDGALALAQYRSTSRRFTEHGLDFYGGFTLGERHMIATNGIIYDRDDAEMTANAKQLFHALLDDAAQQRYGEYRTHLSFMDAVADSFDFNDRALARLNEKLTDALDPNGILAPGKQGIWPRTYKSSRA
jgi:4-cresol dehydrogenase (hydroxylating)